MRPRRYSCADGLCGAEDCATCHPEWQGHDQEAEDEADAVERLTRAARAAVDYMGEDDDGLRRGELRAAVEAAENWGKR